MVEPGFYLFYGAIGVLFHIWTTPPNRPKTWLFYLSLLIDILFWPIVILIFEIKRWKRNS